MAAKIGSSWKTSFQGVLTLFILGMTGVVALAVYSVPSLRSIPELQGLSFPLLLLFAAANSTILLAVFVLFGAVTAPRIGLRSHVYAWATGRNSEWDQFRDSLRIAIGLGVVLFAIIAILDVLFAQFVRLDTGTVVSDAESLRALAESIPMRLLYGGITEELLLRWGLMAPVAWLIWRGRVRLGISAESPSEKTMWTAIVVSAVLFGAGHLPALATNFGLTPTLIVRTVALNSIVGLGFGWLFWRRSLETAMVAHMTFHIVLVVVSTLLIVVI